MFSDKCPLCGTLGRNWKREEGVLQCPNCDSIYSQFGLVIESEKEFENVCT